jgi:hypothetical protein
MVSIGETAIPLCPFFLAHQTLAKLGKSTVKTMHVEMLLITL